MEKYKFFDYFFPVGGNTIFASYDRDFDDEGEGDCKEIIISLDEDVRDEEVEAVSDIFYELCADYELDAAFVDNVELTDSEWMEFKKLYEKVREDGDCMEDYDYKGIPIMVMFCLIQSIYRTQLSDWSEDGVLIDGGGFGEMWADIDID